MASPLYFPPTQLWTPPLYIGEGDQPDETEDPISTFEKRHEQIANRMPSKSRKAYQEQCAAYVKTLKNDYQSYGNSWNALSKQQREKMLQQIANFDTTLEHHTASQQMSALDRSIAVNDMKSLQNRTSEISFAMPRLEAPPAKDRPSWLTGLNSRTPLDAAPTSNSLEEIAKVGRERLVEERTMQIVESVKLGASLSECSGPLISGLTHEEMKKVLTAGYKASQGMQINETFGTIAFAAEVAGKVLSTTIQGVSHAAAYAACYTAPKPKGVTSQQCVSKLTDALSGKNPKVNEAGKKAAREILPNAAIEAGKSLLEVDAALERMDQELQRDYYTMPGVFRTGVSTLAIGTLTAGAGVAGGAAASLAKSSFHASRPYMHAAREVVKTSLNSSTTLSRAKKVYEALKETNILHPAFEERLVEGLREFASRISFLQQPLPRYAYAYNVPLRQPLPSNVFFLERMQGKNAASNAKVVHFPKTELGSEQVSDFAGNVERRIRVLKELQKIEAVPRDTRKMIAYYQKIGYELIKSEGKGGHVKMKKEGYKTQIISGNAETHTYTSIWKDFHKALDKELESLNGQLKLIGKKGSEPIERAASSSSAPLAANENARYVTREVYSFLERPSKQTFGEALFKNESDLIDLIPDYSHLRLPREKVWMQAIDSNTSFKAAREVQHNVFEVESWCGKTLSIKEYEGSGYFHDLVGQDLFEKNPSKFFITSKPIAIGRSGNSVFYATANPQAETLTNIAIKVGSGRPTERKIHFQEFWSAGKISGKGLGERQSIRVKEPYLAISRFSFDHFKGHLNNVNEILRQANLPRIELGEIHLKKVHELNSQTIPHTHGIGSNISLNQITWIPEQASVGLLDLGRIPSHTSLNHIPRHCPAQEFQMFQSTFDLAIQHGLTAQETLKLKNAFKQGYFSELKIEIPKSVHDYYDLYYAIDTIGTLAKGFNGQKRMAEELIHLIEQLNSRRLY